MVSRNALISEDRVSTGSIAINRLNTVWMISMLLSIGEKSKRDRRLFSGILDQRVVRECRRYANHKDDMHSF